MDFRHAVFVLRCDLEDTKEWISVYKDSVLFAQNEVKKCDDELGELIKQFNELIKKRKKLVSNVARNKGILREMEESYTNLQAAMDILRAASDK